MTWKNISTLTDLQARTETGTWLGTSRHTDADSIRRHFSVPAYDESVFDYPRVVPGCLKHARDNSAHSAAGGTDFMAIGPPGAGKSTHALEWSTRLLEVNNRPGMSEAVVWRGSTSRSEWVPLAPWATVCLPASCDVEARLESTDSAGSRSVALEDVVREVRYYEDPRDLFENHVQPGKFHVVYPDPQMTGCQEVYEDCPYEYELEFSDGDPVQHWWTAAVLARVHSGPYHFFVSFIIDEIGDVIPQEASKDAYSSYEKILLFRDTYADARKFGVSVFGYGHSDVDFHEKVKRKVRWRITMNGTANPTRASQVVGVGNVPMNTDLTSHLKTGKCVMWTEQRFCYPLAWGDIPKPTDEELRIRLVPRVPKDPADADAASREDDRDARSSSDDSGAGDGPAQASLDDVEAATDGGVGGR
ncbi:ATP-binding protein [Halobaculum lipolyticum]|uniref:ATP-binding protein n=1 Tax=Halobaculum lipolyticum TaxID=3032001 RepID=UPI0024C40FC3|nr:ATP-binding protein [Halobaculum sp. DT31]